MNGQSKIVKASELGTRCWLPRRFIEGERCPRVMRCKYPEKKTCKAVDAEITYQKEQLQKIAGQIKSKVFQLERNKAGID